MSTVKAHKVAAATHKGDKRYTKNAPTNYLKRIAKASK